MKKLFFLVLPFLLFTNTSGAKDFPELTEFLRKSLISATQGVTDAETQSESTENSFEWNFKRFTLRLKGDIGLEVPWLSAFTISPEVEMVWLKN